MSLSRQVIHGQLRMFKRGELSTSTGALVTARRQVLAIALATAGKAGAQSDKAKPVPEDVAAARVQRARGALAELNPQLAVKVQPAGPGQLELFHSQGTSAGDHDWRHHGQELHWPRALVEVCQRCGVIRRTVRRNERAVAVTYGRAYEGAVFSRLRPVCSPATKESR